jgi:hypothetical protein
MSKWSRHQDLQAVRNLIAQAETLLATAKLSEDTSRRTRQLLATALSLTEHLLSQYDATVSRHSRRPNAMADEGKSLIDSSKTD